MLILAVNVVWAAAFFGYANRSTKPLVAGGEIVRSEAPATGTTARLQAVSVAGQTNLAAKTSNAPAVTATPPVAVVSGGRQFGWQDVTNDLYTNYIVRLRQAGCPDKQVRSIVVADVNELMDKRRLEHAIRSDQPWWRADNYFGVLPLNNTLASSFEEDRRQLLDKLLGENWENTVKLQPLNMGTVPLAGPVLGALPTDTWNAVQEVCERSMDRRNAVVANMTQGILEDSPEMAKLRDFTRTELTKILTTEQLEEFLLRYSRNATKLRMDMRGLDLTPDEFRRIFRAIDPVEHQLQLDYGGMEALSLKQKEQFEAQRERAIRETLTPERYQVYLQMKDPVFRQAQTMAMQYGMGSKAVKPIYELQKTIETRREQISKDTALTPEQKVQALQSIALEQQQVLQKIIGNQAYRQ